MPKQELYLSQEDPLHKVHTLLRLTSTCGSGTLSQEIALTSPSTIYTGPGVLDGR